MGKRDFLKDTRSILEKNKTFSLGLKLLQHQKMSRYREIDLIIRGYIELEI